MSGAAIAALGWSIAANVLALMPHSWNRPGAYTLIALILPISIWLARAIHPVWAIAFVALTVFQLRLLLRHWWRLWRATRRRVE